MKVRVSDLSINLGMAIKNGNEKKYRGADLSLRTGAETWLYYIHAFEQVGGVFNYGIYFIKINDMSI